MLALGLMSSEKKISEDSLAIIVLCKQMTTLGHGQFGFQGLDWQDLCRGPLNIVIY